MAHLEKLHALLAENNDPHSAAWRAGYAAYGIGERVNPYIGAEQRKDWLAGFQHARAVGTAALEGLSSDPAGWGSTLNPPEPRGPNMDGRDLRLAIDVLEKHGEVSVTAEHDQIWLHVDALDYSEVESDPNVDQQFERADAEGYVNPAPMSARDAERIADVGWFVDDEVGSWSHYT